MTFDETIRADIFAPAAPPAQLPVAQRAANALGTSTRATALAELAGKSAGIAKITNKAGYDECHAARMALKRERVEIERLGKSAREDATAFSKAVIAEERRLVAIIEPEEQRLQALQEAEDARVEADRQAKLKAEQDRIAAINLRLNWIRNRALELIGKPTAALAEAVASMEALPVDAAHYAEFVTEAGGARDLALDRLRTMHAASVQADAAAATLEAQRRELAEKQARLDADDKARAERIAKEDAERKFANDYDDAIREDLQRTEDAARAADRAREEERTARQLAEAQEAERINREAREKIERDAAAERARKRAELEAQADPWAALEAILAFDVSTYAAASQLLDVLGKIETIARAAINARVALVTAEIIGDA